MVSPCVDVLRRLAARIHDELGSQQGSKHTVPDLEKDIATLVDSLREHEVYEYKEGRVLDPKDSPVPDILSVGLAALSHGTSTNPLAEFNAQFDRLRERRKLSPISILADNIPVNTSISSSSTSQPETGPSPPSQSHFESDEEEMPGLVRWMDSESESEAGSDPDEDLFADSPTLTREDEDDVALEMDDWCLDASGDDKSDVGSE